MIDILQRTFNRAKLEFTEYLKQKGRLDLLNRVDELFDYSVHANSVNVVLRRNNKDIFNETIKFEELYNINSMLDNIKCDTRLDIILIFNDREIFNNPIESIDDIENVLSSNKEYIFNNIGYVDVSLVHNNKNSLVNMKFNLKKIENFIETLNTHKDIIYEKYIKTYKIDKVRKSFMDNSGGEPIIDIIDGKFIIDEFDQYISDEFGNCLVFE